MKEKDGLAVEVSIVDLELNKLLEKEKNISKVVNRYLRMKFKKRVKRFLGIRLTMFLLFLLTTPFIFTQTNTSYLIVD